MKSPRYRIVAFEGIDGSGKTTIASELSRWLNHSRSALYARLSPQMGALFTRLVDEPSGGRLRYQDLIPLDFRYACYLTEAVVQFRYLSDLYSQYDYLIFDRWCETYDSYCQKPFDHREWYEKLLSQVPKPDYLFFLQITPEIAYERLIRRGDWTAKNWSKGQLLEYLHFLVGRYNELVTIRTGHYIDADQDANVVLQQVIDVLTK